jgi:nicotinate-nucleotide pyrophosphorylase (carboxylating)
MINKQIDDIIKNALKEDIGKEDITTNSIVPKNLIKEAILLVKENGIIAGLDVAREVFIKLDKKILFEKLVEDGSIVKKGQTIAKIKGNARAILTGERVALNLLQRMSGIATLTNQFVRLSGNVKILDTRKTIPNLRILEKYAVKIGGAKNHRFGLYDAILIKDNHIQIAGSVTEAIRRARKANKSSIIEVETTNIKEIQEALNEHADIILLDNMNIQEIKKAVKFINKRAKTEISGGVKLDKIKEISKTGADYASTGFITHSAKALDISLDVIN